MRTLFATHLLVTKHSTAILVAALAATALGGYFASKLTLESDLAELLPSTFESVRALDRIKDEVGGVGNLRIAVEAPDLETGKRFAEHLRPKLLASPLVTNVDYRNDVAFYRHHALLYLNLAQLDSLYEAVESTIQTEKQRLNPLFVDDLFGSEEEEATTELETWEDRYADLEPKEYYTNTDSTVLVVQVAPSEVNTSLAFLREMSDEVHRIVDTANRQSFESAVQVYYGGNIETRLNEYEALKKDILGTALYGLSGVFLLIVIYFRRLTAAILISITLFASLCWTFGLTYLVIGSLNTITGFLFVILFGLGIDYGVHAFARYAESRRAGLGVNESTYNTICLTGKALATTAVTTAAAFFSLTLMDFKGFSDLGFIAGAGMLFALFAMLVVLPALITQAERFGLLRIPPAKRPQQRTQQPFRFVRPILLTATAVSLFAVVTATFVEFEYDFTNLRMSTNERATFGEKTSGAFTLSESPAIILAGADTEIAGIVQAVHDIIDADTISPTVDVVRTVFSLVPQQQPEKLKVIESLRELVDAEAMDVVTGADKERLEKLRQYLDVSAPFTWEDLPAKDRQQFVNTRGEVGNFVFIYPAVPLRDGKNAIEFRNDIGMVTTAAGRTYHAASSNIVLADMLLTMIREGKVAVLLTFAIVFLIVLADLRRLRAALFVLAPLAVGVLWMGGAMFILGMKLNLFNIVVFPTVIGIGVDNGVHIYHRYNEEGPGSLYFVLRCTGLTITMTTLTTMIGYSGLILARHPGLNSIGNLALIGIGATYLTAIIVLPALLEFFERGHQLGQPAPDAAPASRGSVAAG